VLLSGVGLRKEYVSGGSPLVVFSGLAIAVASGEMVAIVGESGTGKSTLLHVLSGLDRPSGGDVYFAPRHPGNDKPVWDPEDPNARCVGRMSEDELAEFRNREIGFVWQFHYLLPEFTALENVMMPLLIRGQREKHAASEAQAMLAEVGLGGRFSHRPGELSGGEQQRVAIARALVTKPSFLMADEPTGNLDEKTGGMIFDLIQGLHQSRGLTSVIVTHNYGFARRCDRVLRLSGGTLQEQTRISLITDEAPGQAPAV
jgi:lipoprotein-releasing system ATP-binding protein